MDLSLEQCRDHWLNAFYTGQVQELMVYEHPEFKVVYEAQGKVESNLSRYACIEHAVQNGPMHGKLLNYGFAKRNWLIYVIELI